MGGNRGTAVGRLPDTTRALKAFEIATPPAGISPPPADAQERADIDPICDGDVLTAQRRALGVTPEMLVAPAEQVCRDRALVSQRD